MEPAVGQSLCSGKDCLGLTGKVTVSPGNSPLLNVAFSSLSPALLMQLQQKSDGVMEALGVGLKECQLIRHCVT